jgi:hypothetical protein
MVQIISFPYNRRYVNQIYQTKTILCELLGEDGYDFYVDNSDEQSAELVFLVKREDELRAMLTLRDNI